jgi:hypothetical protein
VSGYTPVFDSVYHGTLCGRWPALPVWMTILPMADKHGHIDLTYQAISALTGWPIELLKQAIAELMQPDPESRSDSHEGRRLILIDPENRSWGWKVVNHERYREKARKAAYDAQRTASGQDAERKRASRDVPRCPDAAREVPLSDSDANTDSNTNKETALSVRIATKVTPEGEMAIALRDLGVAVRSTDPVLHGWVRDFTLQQALDAVGIARIRKPHPEVIPANYLDKILRQPIRPPPSAVDRVTWRPPDEECA